jgi:hypothetical protein
MGIERPGYDGIAAFDVENGGMRADGVVEMGRLEAMDSHLARLARPCATVTINTSQFIADQACLSR